MPVAPDFPPAPDRAPVRRALISVSDKTGLVEAAQILHRLGVELVSTGGTRAAIAAAGLPVKDVADLTGFPEMMDGRVKTLHPVVHGGLLGVRDAPAHAAAMAEHGIGGIDLVYVNLYPFEATVAAGGDFASAIENIDIGGPAMIRSAAKNHGYVAVCTELEDLKEVLAELAADGTTSLALRKALAARAYARTAAYDAAISTWFARELGETAPRRRTFSGKLAQTLRYGENPHQAAAFYVEEAPRTGVATARQVQGKALSYNNIADTDAAIELVAEFDPAKSAAVSREASRLCTRNPPATCLKTSPGARGSGMPPVSRRRRSFFLANRAMASSSASGATTTSVKILMISFAAAASRRRLTATMPPKAETGSHCRARA